MKVTFRIRENKDKDLIKWINTLEEGNRSKEIRKLLKLATNKRGN